MRIPDALLDHHADRFIAQRVSAHGVTFEQYLTDPARYDALALEPEPLLPAQRAAVERWAQEPASVLCDPADGCPHCGGDGLCSHCCDD